MKNTQLTLFESTTACFRLSINTMYERTKEDGTTQSTVYVNPVKETGTFRPSCFLVFTYLTNDFQTTKGIYTTVPHIYKIRQMFETMHSIAHSDVAYTTVNNTAAVAPEYSAPVVVDGISKNNDWISLTLIMGADDNSISRKPCVAIQHSKSNSYSSILTLDEFDIIYDIIMHIDFVSIEYQAVIAELVTRCGSTKGNNSYTYQQNNGQQYSRPQYNSNVPSYGRHVAPVPTKAPNMPTPTIPHVSIPAPTQAAPVENKLPPRSAVKPVEAKKPMMNPDILESVEIDDDDDSSLIDDIFNN